MAEETEVDVDAEWETLVSTGAQFLLDFEEFYRPRIDMRPTSTVVAIVFAARIAASSLYQCVMRELEPEPSKEAQDDIMAGIIQRARELNDARRARAKGAAN